MAPRRVHITRFQETWLGSGLALAALVAGLVSGFLVQRLGRVRPIQLSSLGFVGGCLCIALGNASLPWMFAGRVLTGFCCSLVSLAVPVFVAETSPRHVRGLLGSGVQLAITLGVLAVSVGGKWLDWLAPTLLCTVGPVLMAVSMALAVESPRWLVIHARRDKAFDAQRFLYGPKYCSEAECLTNEAIVISAADCRIMLSVLQIISSLAAPLLIHRAGRRCLMLVSSLIVTTSLTVLGFFYYYKDMDNGEFRHSYRYVPLAPLKAYMYTCG
ncbi:solute carrier family 2, facilitated glucose transporter member 8-like [Dermacentor variabilis]|uniref:solute carrier family 2, facilitated glucose transporter member 8-like n=1 Tax=Dermacentor variabilis TaxID=34621 RepID=UPI003F5CBC4F